MTTPSRSREQRLSALNNANAIRTYRKQLKRNVKVGKISVTSLLKNPPEEIKSMKLVDLLMATPAIGKSKTDRILIRCRISATKTVGGLSDRQRDEVIALIYYR